MPSPRARSPAPPTPLGPGARPYSPARTPSPARRPTPDPPRTPSPGSASAPAPCPSTLSVPAPDDRPSTPLHHPQPTHLPSSTAPTLTPSTTGPISTALNVRDSSVSAFDFMEAMLAPYERDDNVGDSDEEQDESEESEEIVTPVERPGPRVGDKRDKTPEKVVGEDCTRSLEGSVGDEDIISFPATGVEERTPKRKTVIDFPAPNLHPVKSRSPPMSHPAPDVSRGAQPPRPSLSTPRGNTYTIPHLPSSGVPISPHLAAPPGTALSPPRSPFASPARSSGSSESITGLDLLKEKKALVRGGDDEVFSPISPRKGRQESGLRPGAKPRAGVPSTMDFWKRFSMSVNKMEGVEMSAKGQSQDSEWLSDAQRRRNRIKCMLISGVIVLALMAGGVAAGVVLSRTGHSDNGSGASALCARAGGGAGAGANGAGPC